MHQAPSRYIVLEDASTPAALCDDGEKLQRPHESEYIDVVEQADF